MSPIVAASGNDIVSPLPTFGAPSTTANAAADDAASATGTIVIAPTRNSPGSGSKIAAAPRPIRPAIAMTATGNREVAHVHLAALDGDALRAVRVVDLLRERLDRVEPRDEQRDAGDEDQRRRAAPAAVRAQARDRAEHRDPADSRRRPAEDPLPVPTPARMPERLPLRKAQPRALAGALLGELAVQDDDGAQVLDRRGEPQRADEPRPPLGGFDRSPADAEHPDDRDRERERARRRPRSSRTVSGQNASEPSIDAGDVIVPA